MSSPLAVGCAHIGLQWERVCARPHRGALPPQGGRPAKLQLLHPSARFHRIINILMAHMLWQAPSGESSSTWHTTCMLHPTAAARCCTHNQQPTTKEGGASPSLLGMGARNSTTNHKSRYISVAHLPTIKSSMADTRYLGSLSNKTKCKRITFIHKMYGKL